MFDICHLQGTAKAQGHGNVVIFSLLNFQFNATTILDHWTEVRFNGIASLFGRLDCHDLRDNARFTAANGIENKFERRSDRLTKMRRINDFHVMLVNWIYKMNGSSSRTWFNGRRCSRPLVNHFHLTIGHLHVAECWSSRMPTRSLTISKQMHRLPVVVSFGLPPSHTSSAAFSLAKMKFFWRQVKSNKLSSDRLAKCRSANTSLASRGSFKTLSSAHFPF